MGFYPLRRSSFTRKDQKRRRSTSKNWKNKGKKNPGAGGKRGNLRVYYDLSRFHHRISDPSKPFASPSDEDREGSGDQGSRWRAPSPSPEASSPDSRGFLPPLLGDFGLFRGREDVE